jgi:hypothetical protein
MPDPGQTSTGVPTLATTGNMPPQPSVKEEVVKYMTSLGQKTLPEIKTLLASGELHLSHLGDDVLKLLGYIKQELGAAGGKVAAWGTKPK